MDTDEIMILVPAQRADLPIGINLVSLRPLIDLGPHVFGEFGFCPGRELLSRGEDLGMDSSDPAHMRVIAQVKIVHHALGRAGHVRGPWHDELWFKSAFI